MLYLGHFSFDEKTPKEEDFYGYFSCLVDASTYEGAVKKFRKHISELREQGELFEGSAWIFMDSVIEIQKPPQNAVAVHFKSLRGEPPPVIGCSLVSDIPDGTEVHEWFPEGEDEDADEFVMEPFIKFEYAPKKRGGKKKGPKRKPRRHLKLVK